MRLVCSLALSNTRFTSAMRFFNICNPCFWKLLSVVKNMKKIIIFWTLKELSLLRIVTSIGSLQNLKELLEISDAAKQVWLISDTSFLYIFFPNELAFILEKATGKMKTKTKQPKATKAKALHVNRPFWNWTLSHKYKLNMFKGRANKFCLVSVEQMKHVLAIARNTGYYQLSKWSVLNK